MAAAYLCPIATMLQAFTNAGAVLNGGKVNTYKPGTTTPVTTYTSNTLGIANANPIILDTHGRLPASVWVPSGTGVKIVLTDSSNVTLVTIDNMSAINDPAQLYPQTAAEVAAVVTPSNYSYAAGNVLRYGAVNDGTTDCTAAVNAAIAVCISNNGGAIYFPGNGNHTNGFYLVSGITNQVGPGTRIYGDGYASKVHFSTVWQYGFNLGNNCLVENLWIDGPAVNAYPWSAAAFFRVGDYCTSGGNLYKAIAASSNQIPPNATFWTLIGATPSNNYTFGVGVNVNSKRGVTIRNNFVSGWNFAGISLYAAVDSSVIDNTLFGQVANVSPNNTGGDILLYTQGGGTIGQHLICTGNKCLSDVNLGIGADIQGLDQDLIISGNAVVPLDASFNEKPINTVYCRYGIIASYHQAQNLLNGHIVVSNNIVKNTSQVGIDIEANGLNVPSHLMVNGNTVLNCGFAGGRVWSGNQQASSFGFGIFLNAVSAGTTCDNNFVSGCAALGDPARSGLNLELQSGCIAVNSVTTLTNVYPAASAVIIPGQVFIRGNTCINSATHGIALMYGALTAVVTGNSCYNNNDADITILPTQMGYGGHVIQDNVCIRNDGSVLGNQPTATQWISNWGGTMGSNGYSAGDCVQYSGACYYCAVSVGAPSATAPPSDPYNGLSGHWVAAPTNAWNSGILYNIGDRVSVSGQAYVCSVSNINVSPAPTNGTWTNGTNYTTGQTVLANGSGGPVANCTYICLQNHTASSATQPGQATTWNGVTAYVLNDVVSYKGATFKCTTANTNQIPPTGSGPIPYSSIYWLQIASVSDAYWTPQWQQQQGASPCIAVNGGSALMNRFFITGNTLKSTDYTPYGSRGSSTWQGTQGGSAGIFISVQQVQTFTIERNTIENFYVGMYIASHIPTGRNFNTQGINFNTFRSLQAAVWWAGGNLATADCQFCIGNVWQNTTYGFNWNGYDGNGVYAATPTAQGENVEVIGQSGAMVDPTHGTWVVGDRYINGAPASGSYIGKVCRVGGPAGTAAWTTYGAIT